MVLITNLSLKMGECKCFEILSRKVLPTTDYI